MVFLILLIIATGVLLAWLLYAIGRVTFGELHLPRLNPSPAPGAGAPPEPGRGGGSIAPDPPVRPAEAKAETVRYDESDAERVVREHLYGSHRRT